MSGLRILRLGSVKDVKHFAEHVQSLALTMPCDREIVHGVESPLLLPLVRGESASATESLFNQWKGGMAFRMESRASIRFAGGGDSDRAERNSSGEEKRLRFATKGAPIRINLLLRRTRGRAWRDCGGFSLKSIARPQVQMMDFSSACN